MRQVGPGIVVVDVKTKRHWLAAGAHRGEASRRAEREGMASEVLFGTKWDAIQIGIEDNRKFNGVRITRADKALQITQALKEQPQASGRAIAELVGVDNKTVEARREKLIQVGEISRCQEHVGIDGVARKLPDPTPATTKPVAIPVEVSTSEPGKADTLSVQDGSEELAGPSQIDPPADSGRMNRAQMSITAPGEPVDAIQASDAAICPPKARRREPAAQELAVDAASKPSSGESADKLSAVAQRNAPERKDSSENVPVPIADERCSDLEKFKNTLAALSVYYGWLRTLSSVRSSQGGAAVWDLLKSHVREDRARLEQLQREFEPM